jgi:hypothetical protein
MLRRLGQIVKNPAEYSFTQKLMPIATDRALKMDMMAGIPSLSANFQANAWIFPESATDGHPHACECAWCELYSDLDNYPLPGRTYDLLMALFFASHKSFTSKTTVSMTREAPKHFSGFGKPYDPMQRRF